MKRKSKIKYIMLAILLAVFVVLGAISFVIYDNQVIFTGNRVKNPDCYTLEFSRMNQEDFHTLTLHEGDSLSVDFAIDQGSVDLSIGKPAEDSIYKGNKITSGAFDVIIPEDGDYQITVSARHASGFIMIYAHGKEKE